jgi:hypothetical protein
MTSLSQREQVEERNECVSPMRGETKTASSSGQAGGASRIIMACREFFDSLAPPLGYEDETGFHYGAEPKED